MSRPRFEVADIIRSAGTDFVERNRSWLRWTHLKVLRAIARCRTAALGGHIDECTSCGYRATISYNSCRNRHCPLDSIPSALLPSHRGAAARVSRQVRRRSEVCLGAQSTALSRGTRTAHPSQVLRCLAASPLPQRLDRLLQTTLRRTRVRAPVSRPLYPPRRHLQPPPRGSGARPGYLSLA